GTRGPWRRQTASPAGPRSRDWLRAFLIGERVRGVNSSGRRVFRSQALPRLETRVILRRHEVSPRNALGAARLIGLRAAWYGPFRDRPAPARDLRRPARGARAPGRRDHRRGVAHQPAAGIAARA